MSLPPGKATYQLGELFAGAGGMAVGASQAKLRGNKFRHVWINDIDRDACRTFAHNLPVDEQHVFCCNASELDFAAMPSIDGLVFGFPCNDYSIVGERKGITGHYGSLYQQGVRALRAQKPLFFIAENVDGIQSSGDDLRTILEDLERAGYTVFKHIYRFEEYGVPQSRHRIIITGFRKDLGIEEFEQPAPTTKDNPVTCRDALKGIGADVPNNEETKHAPQVIERLRHIKPGENAFTAAIPGRLQLKMKSQAMISQVYRRLRPDKPAYTVTGSGGGHACISLGA